MGCQTTPYLARFLIYFVRGPGAGQVGSGTASTTHGSPPLLSSTDKASRSQRHSTAPTPTGQDQPRCCNPNLPCIHSTSFAPLCFPRHDADPALI